jgi:hypothetical protein
MYITYNIDGWEWKSGLVRWRLVWLRSLFSAITMLSHATSKTLKNVHEADLKSLNFINPCSEILVSAVSEQWALSTVWCQM